MLSLIVAGRVGIVCLCRLLVSTKNFNGQARKFEVMNWMKEERE